MNNIAEILEFIWSRGWIAFLVILLLLIIHDPDRAEKIKELFLTPTFRLFKLGSRQYMAAKVGYTSTQFLKKEIMPFLPSLLNVKIQLHWVKSPSDPVLKEDGSLVLCMRETNDQTRNILAATQVALPQIVCTTLRPTIHDDLEDAIDLTLLQKLSSALGKHAKPVFQKYFLGPCTKENSQLQALFAKLVELDVHGTFVSIFLEELDSLGEQLYSAADAADRTEEIINFLEFLLAEARRKKGEEITLDYFSSDFSVSIIILALSKKVFREGINPYVNRVNRNIKQGCDSIYIIAYPNALHFLNKLLSVLESDYRLTLAKVAAPKVHSPITHRLEKRKIVLMRRNPLFTETDFSERIAAHGLAEGSVVDGQVLDVSSAQSFVDVLGFNAIIQKQECSWLTIRDCRDVLMNGELRPFMIKKVNEQKASLVLSLKFPEYDPWKSANLPAVGERIQAKVSLCDGTSYYCTTQAGFEVVLPRHEISWTDPVDPSSTELIGAEISLVIIERDDERPVLKGSIRQIEDDPWPLIHERLPKGTQLRGTVIEVTPDAVRVSLPDGLSGLILRQSMEKAGFELADFHQTVVEGQGLDVVVTKVFLKKQRIRLDLLRNIQEA